jgi:hypothetical protein
MNELIKAAVELEDYLVHRFNCPSYFNPTERICECGLTEKLSRFRELRKFTQDQK